MHRLVTAGLAFVIVVALAGWAVFFGIPALPAQGLSGTSTPPATVASVPTPTATLSTDPTIAAIQAVIQKANQEQQDAFARNDPSIMKDTATDSYYNELVTVNQNLAANGVSAIRLVKIEWGPITLTSATTAEATTYETWLTTYKDGSTDQSRAQNVYELVQEQGVWKIQSDSQPGTSPAQPSATVTPAPTPSVSPAAPAPSSQVDTSHNWSGYAATGGQFTSVSGTWTVPQTQSTGGFASAATWVGIGGVSSRDLIQAGTQDVSSGSRTEYQAWIETLPQPSRQVPFSVSPGDSVTVSISQQSPNHWTVSFINHSTGETYQTTLTYTSSLSSAEWIEEAPSARRGVLPLDNFGTVQFSDGTAVRDGQTVTIAESGAKPIAMADASGLIIASPSVLTPDGKGFSVVRTPSTPAAQPTGGASGFQDQSLFRGLEFTPQFTDVLRFVDELGPLPV